jgi:hypothetical protein
MMEGSAKGLTWQGRNGMDRRGNGVYISGGSIALIIIILLLIWIL